ncbi:MAG TPA: hypothetical protein DCS42_13965 [Nitrospiraceae bacterium]|jgi:hypothetical protein|nr:hypothetical protein [Nitrospiraceae bacterium]HAS55135.1 hypothetical protein [Nitrospiraceae bacterium]
MQSVAEILLGAVLYHKEREFLKRVFKKVVYNKNHMVTLPTSQAESFSIESFRCGNCDQDFQARVITWVDVSRAPQVRKTLLRWEFNNIQCTNCGCRHFSGTPFFYEDFEEGLLVAVFPRIPDERGTVEATIREKYGYYPVLEYFYDMTQIWTLLYLQEHYRANKNLRALSRIGKGEERLTLILRFLKEDPLMIDIREKLTETFFGDATEDDLVDLLSKAIYKLEQMLPWPLDRRCLCGADLSKEFKCCGQQIDLDEHEARLSPLYIIYCPLCEESLAGASCEACGRVYTWKLGTVETAAAGAPDCRRNQEAPRELQDGSRSLCP